MEKVTKLEQEVVALDYSVKKFINEIIRKDTISINKERLNRYRLIIQEQLATICKLADENSVRNSEDI